MATRQNADYGHDIQKLYIEMLLGDAETFVRCQGIWDPQLFDKKLQPAAAFLKNYVDEHNIIPTPAIVNAATGQNFSIPEGLQEQHYDWLLNEFETFIRHKGLEKAILEAADMLEKGEYGTVEEKIKRAVQVGLQKDLGTDYFADPRARLLKIKDNNGQMSTGWAALDEKMYGGANRGELWIFAGASGSGKSVFLANLAINYALQGKHVAYITLELSEELVAMRIDSMLTGVSTREVFKQIDDVEMKVKVIGKKAGSIQLKYMPSGKTANDLRAYLKEYTIKTNNKIDVLIIDYLDLMHPYGIKVNADNVFQKDKHVSEELRNLAMEQKCTLLTASQLNRCLGIDTIVTLNGSQQPIKNVKIHDKILSNGREAIVTEVFPIAKQPVYLIKTKSGKTIKCSARHLFPTTNGLKNIENGLQTGDTLYSKAVGE